MRTITIVLFWHLITLTPLCAQDWCKTNDPAQLENPPGIFEDKLVSDRFFHTVNPEITRYKTSQIDLAVLLRPEFFEDDEWTQNDEYSLYNVYSNLGIKHAFYMNLEFHVYLTDVIIKADQEIREYSRQNLNTSLSMGAKYNLNQLKSGRFDLALYGQLTIPKPEHILKTILSPELRFLLSHPMRKRFTFTCNLGTAYSNYNENMIFLYALNIKLNLGKRFELFTEFYKNYTKSGPPRSPNKTWVLGFGFYILENLYWYSSFEGGWETEGSLNDGRIDLGLSYRLR